MAARRYDALRGCGFIAAGIIVILLAAGVFGLVGLRSGIVSPPAFELRLERVTLFGVAIVMPCRWDNSRSPCGPSFYTVGLIVEHAQQAHYYQMLNVRLKTGSVVPSSPFDSSRPVPGEH